MNTEDHFVNVCIPPPATTLAAAAAGVAPSFVEQYRLNKDGDKIIDADPSIYHMLGVFFEENDTVATLKEKIVTACKKSHSKDPPLKGIQALRSQKGSIMDDEMLAAHCFEKNSYVFVCRAVARGYKKRVSESAQPETKKAKVEEASEAIKKSKVSKPKPEEKAEKVKKVVTKTPKEQKLEPKKAETEKKVKKKSAVKEKVVSPPPVAPTAKKSKAAPSAKLASKKAIPPPPSDEEEVEEEVVLPESDGSEESEGEDSD